VASAGWSALLGSEALVQLWLTSGSLWAFPAQAGIK